MIYSDKSSLSLFWIIWFSGVLNLKYDLSFSVSCGDFCVKDSIRAGVKHIAVANGMDISLAELIAKQKSASSGPKSGGRKKASAGKRTRQRDGRFIRNTPYSNGNKKGSLKKRSHYKAKPSFKNKNRGNAHIRMKNGKVRGGQKELDVDDKRFQKLILHNLVRGVKMDDIYDIFSSVGYVHRVTLLGGGSGFLFVDPQDADKMISEYHDRELDGKRMQVRKVRRNSVDTYSIHRRRRSGKQSVRHKDLPPSIQNSHFLDRRQRKN